MKTTLWLWTAVTAMACVCLQVSALPYSNTRVVQENSLLSLKRTKPSLSIVNPLDVLRQRIILEMARRQMRENTRQVELNKALLREIGKRSSNLYDGSEYPLDYSYYDRKMYNQRIAPEPDHRNTAEDELEAMVETLLRNSRLANKLQRTRSVNDRKAPVSHHASTSEQALEPQVQPEPSQTQPQQQQLNSLFNNEREDPTAKDQGFSQSLVSPDQERDITNDNSEDDDDPTDDQQLNGGALKATHDGVSFLESNHQTPNDRGTGNDAGPRYVYGMYKNRYAN